MQHKFLPVNLKEKNVLGELVHFQQTNLGHQLPIAQAAKVKADMAIMNSGVVHADIEVGYIL